MGKEYWHLPEVLFCTQVSKHTGRIHLYSCNPGTNSRPTPLFKNIRPEEVECGTEENEKPSNKSIEDILPYMESLIAFTNAWKNLRPIEKRKLVNKPLQLPLSCELLYLEEGVNHDKGVCILKENLNYAL